MLTVGDRVVLRANAPPETEYALFEISDIELRSSEPGRVREHGYQTTAGRARERLAALGVTAATARECALSMHPVLSTAYSRGAAVRHVSRYLGPQELFQSDTYEGGAHLYHGVFVDLPTLVSDLQIPGASAALQALYLATVLETEADDTTVFLATDAWTKLRKPGERTHRRPNLGAIRDLKAALAGLAATAPRPAVHEQLARADVIAFIRARTRLPTNRDVRFTPRSSARSPCGRCRSEDRSPTPSSGRSRSGSTPTTSRGFSTRSKRSSVRGAARRARRTSALARLSRCTSSHLVSSPNACPRSRSR